MDMKILIACEESQEVCKAFRERGFEAYSCDIQDCSGGHPEWHIKDDVLKHLDENWDLIIAHPPCTYLSVAGNAYLSIEKYGDKALERIKNRELAYDFFMQFVNAPCERIAIENPVGYMNTHYRKADQIIHPYYFAKDINDLENYHLKRTCLWLKGLPLLQYNILPKPEPLHIQANGKKRYFTDAGHFKNRSVERSKTFPGIAKAMAEQWGDYLLKGDEL